MQSPKETKQWIINEKPTAQVTDQTFKLVTKAIPSTIPADSVLLKLLYLSNDPAQRGWIQKGMDPARAYFPPPNEGDVMPARGICMVLETGSSAQKYKKGDLVIAQVGWSQYGVIGQDAIQPAPQVPGMDPAIGLGVLGLTGTTAHYGLLTVGKATSSDQCVVVSGAAGATGSVVIQIAKHVLGISNVIGIAGGQEKCKWVESLGADRCIDYKSSSWKQELKQATKSKTDVYFDNVGDEMLDTMLPLMIRHGRVVACGAISVYNSPRPTQLRNWFEVISNRLSIMGFIVLDALPKIKEIQGDLGSWIKDGKVKIEEGKSQTTKEAKIEQVPEVWKLLFTGGNSGKLVTKLVD